MLAGLPLGTLYGPALQRLLEGAFCMGNFGGPSQ